MFKLLARLAYTVAVLIQALLMLRFIIILFKVNTSNSIISWVMNTSNGFVSPFNGVLSNPNLVINGFVVDLTIIVALFFYLVVGFIAIEILKAFSIN